MVQGRQLHAFRRFCRHRQRVTIELPECRMHSLQSGWQASCSPWQSPLLGRSLQGRSRMDWRRRSAATMRPQSDFGDPLQIRRRRCSAQSRPHVRTRPRCHSGPCHGGKLVSKGGRSGLCRRPTKSGSLVRERLRRPGGLYNAVSWYRKAADQGNAAAQLNLGIVYDNGWGVAQNYVIAYMWFSLAAAMGDSDAARSRDSDAEKLTPAQIAKAQRLAAIGSRSLLHARWRREPHVKPPKEGEEPQPPAEISGQFTLEARSTR
jgi:hypothetical protein